MNPTPPGVILVILDSLRADAVDLDGSGRTPYLASMAEEGGFFSRAVAPAAWTLPSHVSMMSGLYPTEHRIHAQASATEAMAMGRREISKMAREGKLLPTWLAEKGVATYLGSANVWLSKASGITDLFQSSKYVSFPRRREEHRGEAEKRIDPRGKDVPRLPPSARSKVPLPIKHAGRVALERVQVTRNAMRQATPHVRWALSRDDKGGEIVVDDLNRWLGTVDKPFFAMLNLIETHGPHLAPEGYGPRDWRGTASTFFRPGQRWTRRTLEHNWGDHPLPDAVLARLRRAYAAEVSYADTLVGRILERLTATGQRDSTTLIVTGDHGEALGEHGLIGHGMSLGQPAAGVPLVMSGAAGSFSAVEEPVSLASLAATTAELLVDDAHPFPRANVLGNEGRGRARFEVESPWTHFPPPRMRMQRAPDGMDEPAAAFFDGRFKLIVGSFWKEALFDLDADPKEEKNLIGTSPVPEGIKEMRAEWERLAGVS